MSVKELNHYKYFIAIGMMYLSPMALAGVPVQAPVPSHIKRISGVLINTGEVLGIYVSPGLATLIESPCPVSEVTVGNPKDITKEISEKNPNDVKIFLSSSLSQSSNLIIRCPGEVIVLDLYPSRTTHQDYLKIESTYGGPELSGVKLSPVGAGGVEAVDSPETEKNLILIRKGGEENSTSSPSPPSVRTDEEKSKGIHTVRQIKGVIRTKKGRQVHEST